MRGPQPGCSRRISTTEIDAIYERAREAGAIGGKLIGAGGGGFLLLYVPPERKPWMSEDPRMGIFDAAALAWMYFHEREGDRHAA